MTTPEDRRSRLAAAKGLRRKLRQLRRGVTRWFLVDGVNRILLAIVGLCVASFLIDRFFRMDRAQRGVMLGLMIFLAVWVAWRYLLKPLAARVSEDALCLELERQNPKAAEKMISALEFSRMDWSKHENVSMDMVERTIREGEQIGRRMHTGTVLFGEKFAGNVFLLGLLAVIVGGTVSWGMAKPDSMIATWFDRNVMLGNAQWPQDHILEIEGAEGGNLAIPRGDDWPLMAKVREGYFSLPDEVKVEIKTTSGTRFEYMDDVGEGMKYRVLLPSVSESFQFRLITKKFESAWYNAVLVNRPELTTVRLTVSPPKYTGVEPQELPAGSGPYYLLDGTSLRIEGGASKSLKLARLIAGEKHLPLPLTGATTFSGDIPPGNVVAGTYWIEIEDTEELLLPGAKEMTGLGAREPARFKVRIKADKTPSVKAALQGVSGLVVPNARIPYNVKIEDDYAVESVRIDYAWKSDDAEAKEQTGTMKPEGDPLENEKTRVAYDSAIELGPMNIPANSRLSFRFKADDNDTVNGPKVGESTRLLLRVVSESDLRMDLLRREKEQRQILSELLTKQDILLTDCQAMQAEVRGIPELSPSHRDRFVRLQKRQKLLGSNLLPMIRRMTGIVDEIANNRLDDEENTLSKRIMENVVAPIAVAHNTSPLAVIALGSARRDAEGWESRHAKMTEAIQHQQQIIAEIKKAIVHMVKNEDFQMAVNLLYEIQKSQQDLKKLTEEEKQRRIEELLKQEAEKRKANDDNKPVDGAGNPEKP